MPDFIHLHVHDQYSLLDGMGNSKDYAIKAKELGMSHLALTNHGNVDGCISFSKNCKEQGITPILGAELYLVEDHTVKEKGDRRSHITLLVKNETGWKNLQKIITISNIEGFYYKPRVSPQTIIDNCEGLIVMSACAASFIHEEWGDKFLFQLLIHIKKDVYLEVMPHLFQEQINTNLKAIELSETYGFKLVATNDVHYTNESDSICQEVLLAVQTKKKWKDEDRWKFKGDGYYLKSRIEMAMKFREQAVLTNEQYSEALLITKEIAEKCDFELTGKSISLPRLPGVKMLSLPEDDIEILKTKCEDGFIKRKCDTPKYRKRYEEEISLIKEKGFERYFLMVWELVSWAHEQGIMMSPGRGCFLPDTPIQSPSGDLIPISKIKPGDNVINEQSEVDTVKCVYDYEVEEEIISLKTMYGVSDIQCTKDHKILSFRPIDCYIKSKKINKKCTPNCPRSSSCKKYFFSHDGAWTKAENLLPGDYVFLPKIKINNNFDEEIDFAEYSKNIIVSQNQKTIIIRKGFNKTTRKKYCIKTLSKKHNISVESIRNIINDKITVRGQTKLKFANILKKEGIGSIKEFINIYIPYIPIAFNRFQKIDNDFLRFIGMYIGNGWTRKGMVGIAFHADHKDKVDFVVNFIKKRFGDHTSLNYGYKGKKCVQVIIKFAPLERYINSIVRKYAQNKHLPDFYLSLDKEQSLSLLQGLVDTDGSIGKNDSRIHYDSISFRLISQIRFMLLKFGVPSVVRKRKKNSSKRRPSDSYKLSFRMKEFNDFVPQSKVKYYIDCDKHIMVRIKETKKIEYTGKVYDLCIENKPSFSTSNFIAHNSSAGSLVCYLLGITNADPLVYNLVFARFIAPLRQDIPDIDMDFADNRREEIRKHLEEIYGKWNVAGASTYSRMKGRSALRDVSRVFDIPMRDVNKAAAIIDTKLDGEEGAETTIADSFLKFEDGIAFSKKYPDVSEIAMSLEGQIRGKGQHAAAIVVADEDLREGARCCFQLGKDKEPIINWDKNDLEYMGLMKLDILGLEMLTVLNDAKRRVKINHGIDIDYDSIPFDDRRALDEFNNGNTIGCFQFGSHGIREFCKRIGVDDFRTVININALYRPGTLRSGESENFIKRKKGEEQVPSQHFVIDDITKDTYGIILYQEQVMELVHRFAGLDWGIADQVRKVVAKSKGEEAMRKFEDQFVQGCAKTHEYPDSLARALWQTLLACGGYLFNLSHATTYSMLSWWGMYMKVYYPSEYFCSLLTHGVSDSDQNDKKGTYVEECFRLGMDVRPPKVGISDAYEWVEKDGILYMPFIDIKGIGPKTAEKFKNIHLDKEGFYNSIVDYEKDYYATHDDWMKMTKKVSYQKCVKILLDIKADVDEPITDEEADRIKDYLSVSLIKDPVAKFKNLKSLISQHLSEGYWFGYVTELNLGIKKGGIASAYGMMRCEGIDYKISFDEVLYRDKKNLIEHCESQIVIVYAEEKFGGLYISKAWFEPEIMSFDLEGLGIYQSEERSFVNTEIINCEDCELRQECTEPVLPSRGRTNVMIIGEGPGFQEDIEGKGFVGASGQNLWAEFDKYNLTRREFHITNVVKCFPGKDIKTPTRKHINKCRKWLDEEFENLKPRFVLAFGNTSVKFFTENDSGIMNLSGTTTWNEKYGCWICWCIHPASMLYSPENRELFEKGIKNFYERAVVPF